MGVIITFDLVNFKALFPAFFTPAQGFTPITDDQVNMVLPLATSYCRNDGGGPVDNSQVQTNLVNLAVAHCLQLLFGSSNQTNSGLVGRITSASQGSVSVQVGEFPSTPSSAWWNQTQYGAMWWQLALPYRLGRYIPKVLPQWNPYGRIV